MTFDAIKKAVKDYCNLSSQDADTRVGESINQHYRRVTSLIGMDSTRFVTRSATTTAGVRYVTFSEIEKIDRVIDTTDSTAIRVLTEVEMSQQRATQPATGAPNAWALQATGASSVTVLLDNLPQTSYSLQADGWATVADLMGNDSPAFPESFHNILTWFVLAEELLKKEKVAIAAAYEQKATKLQSDLVFHMANSETRDDRAGSARTSTGSSGGGSGGGSVGGTAYTQTALLTFDLGAGVAPFAVAEATAPTVTNLDADKLDGEDGTFYLNRANHTGSTDVAVTEITPVTTDRLIGRDTAGTGAAEQLTVGGGLEFTGSGGIQRSALTGDVTAAAGSNTTTIPADSITDAKLRESAATSVIGRSANSTGNPADITATTNNTVLARISNALSWVAGLVFDGAGAIQQIAFAATQSASSDANTLDDYEEGTWTPADGSGASLSLTLGTCQFVKIGQLVIAHYDITYPSTANGSASLISGLPFTCQTVTGWGGGLSQTNVATTITARVNSAATTFTFYDMSGTNIVNSTLSTRIVRGVLMYRASA